MLIGTTVRSPRGDIQVAVLVEGIEQTLYRRQADGKIFVAGTPERVYTLRLKNLTYGRIEVINTVDGRHTLDDEPGDAIRNRGMVFSRLSTGVFSGWRISDQQTRAFVFGQPEVSIAARSNGSTQNVGVIGFAVHRERVSQSVPIFGGGSESLEAPRGGTKGGFATRRTTRGGSLGTGMGAVQQDRVGHTSFERDDTEPDLLIIGYDTEDVLRAQGIIAPAEPNPFPGATTGYARY